MKLIRDTILYGGIIGLLFLGFTFLFDGLGGGKVQSYFEYYSGNMGYHYYQVTFRPISSESIDKITRRNLNYGYKLTDSKVLNAKIIHSEIPKNDIEYIFYNPQTSSQLSPDSTYTGWIGLRANYFSFLFRDKHGFELKAFSSYPSNDYFEESFREDKNWMKPVKAYAVVSLLLIPLFWMAVYCIFRLEDMPQYSGLIPLLFIGLYAAAQAYLIKLDFEYTDWPWFSAFYVAILLALYIYLLRSKKKKANPEFD